MQTLTENDPCGRMGMIVKRVSVPIGLEELMEGLSKEVLLKKPKDLYVFASEYFSRLVLLRGRSNKYKAPSVRSVQSVSQLKSSNLPPTKQSAPTRPKKHLSRQVSVRSKSPIITKSAITDSIINKDISSKGSQNKLGIDRKEYTSSNVAKSFKPQRDRSVSTSRHGASKADSSVQSTPREKRQQSVPRKTKLSIPDKERKESKKPKQNKVKTALILPTVVSSTIAGSDVAMEGNNKNDIKENSYNNVAKTAANKLMIKEELRSACTDNLSKNKENEMNTTYTKKFVDPTSDTNVDTNQVESVQKDLNGVEHKNETWHKETKIQDSKNDEINIDNLKKSATIEEANSTDFSDPTKKNVDIKNETLTGRKPNILNNDNVNSENIIVAIDKTESSVLEKQAFSDIPVLSAPSNEIPSTIKTFEVTHKEASIEENNKSYFLNEVIKKEPKLNNQNYVTEENPITDQNSATLKQHESLEWIPSDKESSEKIKNELTTTQGPVRIKEEKNIKEEINTELQNNKTKLENLKNFDNESSSSDETHQQNKIYEELNNDQKNIDGSNEHGLIESMNKIQAKFDKKVDDNNLTNDIHGIKSKSVNYDIGDFYNKDLTETGSAEKEDNQGNISQLQNQNNLDEIGKTENFIVTKKMKTTSQSDDKSTVNNVEDRHERQRTLEKTGELLSSNEKNLGIIENIVNTDKDPELTNLDETEINATDEVKEVIPSNSEVITNQVFESNKALAKDLPENGLPIAKETNHTTNKNHISNNTIINDQVFSTSDNVAKENKLGVDVVQVSNSLDHIMSKEEQNRKDIENEEDLGLHGSDETIIKADKVTSKVEEEIGENNLDQGKQENRTDYTYQTKDFQVIEDDSSIMNAESNNDDKLTNDATKNIQHKEDEKRKIEDFTSPTSNVSIASEAINSKVGEVIEENNLDQGKQKNCTDYTNQTKDFRVTEDDSNLMNDESNDYDKLTNDGTENIQHKEDEKQAIEDFTNATSNVSIASEAINASTDQIKTTIITTEQIIKNESVNNIVDKDNDNEDNMSTIFSTSVNLKEDRRQKQEDIDKLTNDATKNIQSKEDEKRTIEDFTSPTSNVSLASKAISASTDQAKNEIITTEKIIKSELVKNIVDKDNGNEENNSTSSSSDVNLKEDRQKPEDMTILAKSIEICADSNDITSKALYKNGIGEFGLDESNIPLVYGENKNLAIAKEPKKTERKISKEEAFINEINTNEFIKNSRVSETQTKLPDNLKLGDKLYQDLAVEESPTLKDIKNNDENSAKGSHKIDSIKNILDIDKSQIIDQKRRENEKTKVEESPSETKIDYHLPLNLDEKIEETNLKEALTNQKERKDISDVIITDAVTNVSFNVKEHGQSGSSILNKITANCSETNTDFNNSTNEMLNNTLYNNKNTEFIFDEFDNALGKEEKKKRSVDLIDNAITESEIKKEDREEVKEDKPIHEIEDLITQGNATKGFQENKYIENKVIDADNLKTTFYEDIENEETKSNDLTDKIPENEHLFNQSNEIIKKHLNHSESIEFKFDNSEIDLDNMEKKKLSIDNENETLVSQSSKEDNCIVNVDQIDKVTDNENLVMNKDGKITDKENSQNKIFIKDNLQIAVEKSKENEDTKEEYFIGQKETDEIKQRNDHDTTKKDIKKDNYMVNEDQIHKVQVGENLVINEDSIFDKDHSQIVLQKGKENEQIMNAEEHQSQMISDIHLITIESATNIIKKADEKKILGDVTNNLDNSKNRNEETRNNECLENGNYFQEMYISNEKIVDLNSMTLGDDDKERKNDNNIDNDKVSQKELKNNVSATNEFLSSEKMIISLEPDLKFNSVKELLDFDFTKTDKEEMSADHEFKCLLENDKKQADVQIDNQSIIEENMTKDNIIQNEFPVNAGNKSDKEDTTIIKTKLGILKNEDHSGTETLEKGLSETMVTFDQNNTLKQEKADNLKENIEITDNKKSKIDQSMFESKVAEDKDEVEKVDNIAQSSNGEFQHVIEKPVDGKSSENIQNETNIQKNEIISDDFMEKSGISKEITFIKANAKEHENEKKSIDTSDITQIASAINIIQNIMSSNISSNRAGLIDFSVKDYLNTFIDYEQNNVFQNLDSKSNIKSLNVLKPTSNINKFRNAAVIKENFTNKKNKLDLGKKARSLSQANILNNVEQKNSTEQEKGRKLRRVKSVDSIKAGDNDFKTKIPTSARNRAKSNHKVHTKSSSKKQLVRQLEADSRDLEENQDAKNFEVNGIQGKTNQFRTQTQIKNKIVTKEGETSAINEDAQIAKTILTGIKGAEKHIELIEKHNNKNEASLLEKQLTNIINENNDITLIKHEKSDESPAKQQDNLEEIGAVGKKLNEEKKEYAIVDKIEKEWDKTDNNYLKEIDNFNQQNVNIQDSVTDIKLSENILIPIEQKLEPNQTNGNLKNNTEQPNTLNADSELNKKLDEAATTIQKNWRGHEARKDIKHTKLIQLKDSQIERSNNSIKELALSDLDIKKENSATILQSFWRGYKLRKYLKSSYKNELEPSESNKALSPDKAAIKIQAIVRGFLERIQYDKHKTKNVKNIFKSTTQKHVNEETPMEKDKKELIQSQFKSSKSIGVENNIDMTDLKKSKLFDKPDFYRTNTVEEPKLIKKLISNLGNLSKDDKPNAGVLTPEMDNNNNRRSKDSTEMEREVRTLVDEIVNMNLDNDKKKLTRLETEIGQAVRNIMTNNIVNEDTDTPENDKMDEVKNTPLCDTSSQSLNNEKCLKDTVNATNSQVADTQEEQSLSPDKSEHIFKKCDDNKTTYRASFMEDEHESITGGLIPDINNTQEERPITKKLDESDKNEVMINAHQLTLDESRSVDSTDSVVTVIDNKSYENKKEEKDPETRKLNHENQSLTVGTQKEVDAIQGHVDLIHQVQNTLLDQISGKLASTNSKFDIAELRKELQDAASLYSDESNLASTNVTKDDELLEYLNDLEPEDENNYDSRMPKTPIRELPDIKEEEGECKEDDVNTAKLDKDIAAVCNKNVGKERESNFCGTPNAIPHSPEKIIDGKPLNEIVEVIHDDISNNGSIQESENQISINFENGTKESTEGVQNNSRKLLHSSELHDTVVIPLASNSPQGVSVNVTNLNKDVTVSRNFSDSTGLKHTSEFHDTVVIPLGAGTHAKSENESKEPIQMNTSLEKDSQAVLVDSGNQTATQQAPAGAAVVTSRRSFQDHGADDDSTGAQASLKAALLTRPESTEPFMHQSPQSSRFTEVGQVMESENNNKRNNAISHKAPTGRNMEAEAAAAAAKIQAGFRGYQVRKQLKMKNASSDKTNPKRQIRRKNSGREGNHKDLEIEEKSAVKIQAGVRGFLVRRRQKKQINSSASA